MSRRSFINEEEYEDVMDDAPLKLHSVLDFLDDAKATLADSATEHHHVSSNDSESGEDVQSAETSDSLRLTPFITAAATPRQCYCLDKASCMCSSFLLPPLLTRKPLPSATAPPTAVRGALSSSFPDQGAEASAGAALSTSAGVCVRCVPLHLVDLHLAKPQDVPSARMTASSWTGTTMTCCRC
ncbi:hypothetical protein ABL78_5099 [Leptomonas seymouri]|uniref:Uncharacterized protein n=1 Tax=Leptomonas seymouri TaxID=5684 RepID=A0A0N1HXC4_LEPSE|nr:hypothetical protein ABL78_5099 [Leptomonas seymouri]|eukprot:KPI85845.1 hypothetical protein ABL78_5099 [Leptomonas seymouri]